MRSDERLVLMPVLAPGSHAHPRIGGCFAEVAAALATNQWTDYPTCIPQVLAQIARRVNDLTSPEARTDLAPLIPWAVCRPHPSAHLIYDTAVTTAVIEVARSALPGNPDLDPVLQQLLGNLGRATSSTGSGGAGPPATSCVRTCGPSPPALQARPATPAFGPCWSRRSTASVSSRVSRRCQPRSTRR